MLGVAPLRLSRPVPEQGNAVLILPHSVHQVRAPSGIFDADGLEPLLPSACRQLPATVDDHDVGIAANLALIEYWAVDPDYDGEVFRSVWQDYRGNIENDDDELRVVTTAAISLPSHEGPRKVCVRAVDVFGFESEVVVEGVEVGS